jgi:hypothetical protein
MELYDKIVLFFRMKIPIGHGKKPAFFTAKHPAVRPGWRTCAAS